MGWHNLLLHQAANIHAMPLQKSSSDQISFQTLNLVSQFAYHLHNIIKTKKFMLELVFNLYKILHTLLYKQNTSKAFV